MAAFRGIMEMVSEDYLAVRHRHGYVGGGGVAGVIWNLRTGSLAD